MNSIGRLRDKVASTRSGGKKYCLLCRWRLGHLLGQRGVRKKNRYWQVLEGAGAREVVDLLVLTGC